MIQQDIKIGFIGAGNMSSALIGGLIADNFPAKQIVIADPNSTNTENLSKQHGLTVAISNRDLATQCQLIILGVKPQFVVPVCEEIADSISNAVVVSVAAGIPTISIANSFASGQAIIRVMPNTPALISEGASGLYANPDVSENQRLAVAALFNSVGQTAWLDDEGLMDLVTAISGSGPAYFFYLVETMIDSAVAQGMNREQAEILIKQTALGAAKMLIQSTKSPGELREAVTSPGGTTAAAMKHLQNAEFAKLIDGMVRSAVRRGQELSNE